MEKREILDRIERTNESRFSLLSFRAFLISAAMLFLFLVFAFINPGHAIFEIVYLSIVVGFIVSNLAGFVLTVKCIMNKEPDTMYKTIGVVGNILFFLVVLGMVGFIVMDLITYS